MAYQLPVASQSDSDLASLSDLWFEMPSPVSSPSRPNNPTSTSPKGKSTSRDQNGYQQPPADNSGFRPGLPTNNSKGPNSPSPITNKGVAASPTSSSTSPAPSSALLQPNQGPTNSNSPPRRRPSLADPSTLQTFYNNPPPPRLQTDLSSLHLLPQLTTQPSPTTTSSPVSPGFRGLGRSPTRHNPSNSHSSFFQEPASAMAAVAPSPTSLPYQHQQQQQQQLHHHVPGGGGKRFVPTMSDAAKLDRSRTLVRNLMGSSSTARRNEGQGYRERSPNGENEARGSARSGQSTPLHQQQGYAVENGRSRTSSYNQQSSLPSPSLARPDEGGGGRETTTIAAPSSLPTSPPSQVQSFESFVGSDGELRRVLIDGRLFQFDSTGTKLSLIDHPPPPTTQVVSPPPANLALPLTPTPVATVEPPKPSDPTRSHASSSTFTPPPKPANLTIDSTVHNPPTNGRASQAFYGDLLGDFGASPTVEAHPDRIRQTIMGSRLAEDSPDSLRSSEEEHWQQQAMRNEGAELAQQQLQEQQNQQQQQQPSSSKRGGFIEPRLTAGEGERKKIVSSAEQLRTLEAKYGIEPRQKSPPQPRATALPSEPQPPPKQQAPPPLEPRSQTQARLPFQPQSPPRQLPTRHQTSPPTSSASSSPTKPSFPPLETKFSSSSIHNPTSPPNAQPSLPHAHPHHPPFQVVDTPSSPALPSPPPDVKEPPAVAPPPSRPAPPPQRVISSASSDDDDYSDDDATPLAFSTKPRPPALPPKDAQAPSSSSASPSSSQQNQIPRRPAREQPPPRASTEDWVVPSPIEGPSSGRPTDPYEVLSRPMPRELDTGGRFGEKLKRGVTGLRKELKKGMTQVQALRPNAPTSPSSPLNTLSSPHPHHAPHHGHSQSHSNPHSHSQAPPLHTRTNSSEPNKHQSPTDHQQHAALPPRPPSPMREALAPQSMTGIEVAERAALIEDEEERKLAESMFM